MLLARLSTTGLALATAALVSLVALVAPAHAQAPASPDKQACVAAFDRGQRAQSDRALRRAQSELIVCSQESCPAVLRADCAGVLTEVRAALPTIVFAANDGNGHELTDVQVFAGSELLAPRLDGRAIAVDPGTVELRFERSGKAPQLVTAMFREGEKNRVLQVVLAGDVAAEGPVRPDPAAPAPRRGTLGWVLPGSLVAVGVTGLTLSLVERLAFDSRVDSLRGSCAPDCAQQQRSDLSGTLVTSNVALGVGIGALALAALTWFLTAPGPASSGVRGASSRPGPRLEGWTW